MSINDYVLKLKTISHSLAAIGEPLNDNELLLAILNGLDQDFDTIVRLITYQMDDIDLEKVQYLLLMHEQQLVVKNVPPPIHQFDSLHSSMSVNMASHSFGASNTGNVGYNQGGYSSQGGGSSFREGRGRGRSSNR